MKKTFLIIWITLIVTHLGCTFLLQNPNYGALILYVTIALLSKTGLPVFINPHSGWGWSEPNLLGWTLSVIVWILLYGGLAFILAKFMQKK